MAHHPLYHAHDHADLSSQCQQNAVIKSLKRAYGFTYERMLTKSGISTCQKYFYTCGGGKTQIHTGITPGWAFIGCNDPHSRCNNVSVTRFMKQTVEEQRSKSTSIESDQTLFDQNQAIDVELSPFLPQTTDVQLSQTMRMDMELSLMTKRSRADAPLSSRSDGRQLKRAR